MLKASANTSTGSIKREQKKKCITQCLAQSLGFTGLNEFARAFWLRAFQLVDSQYRITECVRHFSLFWHITQSGYRFAQVFRTGEHLENYLMAASKIGLAPLSQVRLISLQCSPKNSDFGPSASVSKFARAGTLKGPCGYPRKLAAPNGT